MVRLQAIWFGTFAATILSFISSHTAATAQIIYPFDATYNSENTLTPIIDNISKVTITAESTDAPYGLTKFVNTNSITVKSIPPLAQLHLAPTQQSLV